MARTPDQPVARVGRAPMAPGRERSGPPERRSLAPRSATITVMIRAAFAAAKFLKRDFGEVEHLQISEKGPGDFVSHADIKAERTVRAELARTRPEYGFLGEEGGETKGDGRNRWIVDPLDGTTNFLHGVPHFAISIGARARRRDHRRRHLPADLRRAVLGREGQRRLRRHAQRPLAAPARVGPQGSGARPGRAPAFPTSASAIMATITAGSRP